jgi:hypothetical protein
MIELHPQIIEKDGKKQFVLLTYEEFLTVQEALADADDLVALRIAKEEEHDPTSVPLDDVIKEFRLSG